MSSSHCQVCHKECRPLRCSKCQRAFYCSVKCQKIDWKGGHRRRCQGNATEENARGALQELLCMASNLPLKDAVEQYDRSTDEVKKQAEREIETTRDDQPPEEVTSKTVMENKQLDNPAGNLSLDSRTTETLQGVFDFSRGFLTSTATKSPDSRVSQLIDNQRMYGISFVAEEMKYVSQLRILIRRKETESEKIDFHNTTLSTQRLDQGYNLLSLKSKPNNSLVFETELPSSYRAEHCSSQIEGDDTIHLAIQCEEDMSNQGLELPKGTLAPDDINGLHCKYCEHALLQSPSIKRELQLPSGYLEDIADYLICYNGQPAVDFSASGAALEPQIALQDASVVCLHQEDLGPSICVLAVAGYGDVEDEGDDDKNNSNNDMSLLDNPVATVRGDRPWRETSGGATVCCAFCCAPLGFASPDAPTSIRFLKHRLLSKTGLTSTTFSCASFLAREMARYADVKAIFTFVIFREETAAEKGHRRKCILLRLVSWDSRMATSFEETSRRLKFGQVAKIVFEDTYEKVASNNDNGSDDVSKWIWGGVDLCCPPTNNNEDNPYEKSTGKTSTVRLQLPPDEYDEVLQSFWEGTKLISKAVADATIMVKMGTDQVSNENLGLTAVWLDR